MGSAERIRLSIAGSPNRCSKRVKTDYLIQTVSHACDILEQFLDNGSELKLTDLSKRLGISKNITFRLLATLESRNYIEQIGLHSGYRLGYRNLQLGHSAGKQITLHGKARSVLESLTRECGETSEIAIMRGEQIIYLDAVEASHTVRTLSRVGIITPSYCTAAGKVLLAGEKEQRQYYPIAELRQHAHNTITDRQALEEHLQLVAAQGHAVEDEELDLGLRGVAAPVRDHTGGVVGAVGISGPVIRISIERIYAQLAPLVMKSAAEISCMLGYKQA